NAQPREGDRFVQELHGIALAGRASGRERALAGTEAVDPEESRQQDEDDGSRFPHDATILPARLGRRALARSANARAHTVAMGVAGEPTAPGSRSGGAVRRKRLLPCARSHRASSVKYHISPR